jgi:hypothetical protein
MFTRFFLVGTFSLSAICFSNIIRAESNSPQIRCNLPSEPSPESSPLKWESLERDDNGWSC